MENLEIRFSNWILRLRWLLIPVCLLLVLGATYGLRDLYFTNEYRIYFSKDNPQLLAFDALENTYAKNDNVLIVLEPANGNVFTRETLAAVEEITEKSWQVPYSNRVDSITNFQYTEATGDDLTVRDLVADAGNLTAAELEKIRNIALSEPLLYKRLISASGHVTAVNITVQMPGVTQTEETPKVVAFARNMVRELESAHPDINFYLSGIVMVNHAFQELSEHDMVTLVPASFGIMFLLMFFLVGGITGTLCIILLIALSIVAALGLGGYSGLLLSSGSIVAPNIILTVAIANCVHILITFLYCMQHGFTKYDALRESLRVNLLPVTIASVTTTFAFLTLNFSDAPPIRDLGNFVAFGVVSAYLLSVTLLPALMAILPIHVKQLDNGDETLITRTGNYVVRNRTPLLWGMIILVVLSLTGLPRNELNDNFIHYFDDRTDVRQAADFTTENLTGISYIDYSLDSGVPGGISEPEFLAQVAAFTDWFRQQPETIHVNSITDTFKRLNKNMHGDDESMYRLPGERELAAQYLLLYEMSLPYGLDLNNQINVDKSSTRFTVSNHSISSNELIALDLRARKWLQENAPDILPAEGTGANIMFANIGKRNIGKMLLATVVALFIISIVLVVAFRSIRIGLISLIPNLVPAGMGFGLWGYFVGEVGLSLSVVSTMTLGIIIDDTVHFLSKFLRARREKNLGAEDAVRYAFRTVGRALVITSVILIAGFMVLTTSSFKINSGMGMLTAIVIALALVADFLLLPSVLMLTREKSNAEMLADSTVTDTSIT